MARDEEEYADKKKEDKKNSFISQIIAFWIGVWLWLPKTIYSLWLKVYDSLFGPDKPCPAGGEPQPQPETQPEPEPQPQPETLPPQSEPQPEPTNVEIAQPAPTQLNEPQPSSIQPVASDVAPLSTEQQKPGLNGGGRRRQDLLRKIKNLTRTLKSRSK
jgi:hypothetical protein